MTTFLTFLCPLVGVQDDDPDSLKDPLGEMSVFEGCRLEEDSASSQSVGLLVGEQIFIKDLRSFCHAGTGHIFA